VVLAADLLSVARDALVRMKTLAFGLTVAEKAVTAFRTWKTHTIENLEENPGMISESCTMD
jgi:hypothetical protein